MSASHRTRRVSILLVDDQPARLLTYEEILRDLGHELVCAASGPEALEKLLREEFAVILLDVSMPGMDGFELAGLVHDHPRFEKTPIIFVTGLHVTDFDRLKGYALGAVDYVYVPVVPEILRSKVSVLTELYLKRKELQDLNNHLEQLNAQLLAANTSLQAEKTRALEAANSELARANDALKTEIEERRRLEAELVETDRRKDDFLAMLAHELRNPLAPIRNGVQFMQQRVRDDADLAWCGEMIGRQAGHLSRLVDDLLDVSRITRGKINLQPTTLTLDAVVSQAIETNRPLIEARGHRLAVDLPSHPVQVFGDMTRLVQVVGNLLNNAAKFTEPGGSIRVAVECALRPDGSQEALVRVRDNGIGIPPDMLPKVFELFTQVERLVDRCEGGLGIGLALVRRLAELHGGRVEARSPVPGGGSEFVVALPLAGTPASASPAPPAAVGRSRSASPLRVLVVDDNEDATKSMALLLRELGHEVRTASDGLRGVRLAMEFDPQVVFLDIGMPGLDGCESARRIRELPHAASMQLIALTGYGQAADRRRTREAGFDLHLVKPIGREALEEVLSPVMTVQATQREPDDRPARSEDYAQVAHDLRTPLNALWGTSALLLETPLDARQQEYARLIRASAVAIRRLADELASHGDEGSAPLLEPANAAPARARPLRVLVVDDDPVSRTAMLQMLASLGHASESAADGREVLSAVWSGAFDAILLDIHLDDSTGPEIARALRRHPGRGRPPRIIGVSGSAYPADLEACAAAGMERVLAKPVTLETLGAALEAGGSAPSVRDAPAPDELLDQNVVTSLRSQSYAPGHRTLDRLVDLYAADTPEQIAKLHEAAARMDTAGLAATAHTLKGSSCTVGAQALGALASRIESLARAGDASGSAALVADLERAWPATREALVWATVSSGSPN